MEAHIHLSSKMAHFLVLVVILTEFSSVSGLCSDTATPSTNCDNVAVRQVATQSSTLTGVGYPVGRAVDGAFENCRVYFTHTDHGDTPPHWEVRLDKAYNINSFRVYARVGNCGPNSCSLRLAGFTLSVGNSSGNYRDYYNSTPAGRDPGTVVSGTCTTPIWGDRVRIQQPNQYLSLCEVLVYACKAGTYGPNCGTNCGFCAEGRTVCDTTSGFCPNRQTRCMPGYTGQRCNEACKAGTYGPNCGMNCGFCAEGRTVCDTTSGFCPNRQTRCMPGYTGQRCNAACKAGTYGPNCGTNCGFCAEGRTVCDTTSGFCPNRQTRCMPGYTGQRCYAVCSDGKWGADCADTCGQCNNGAVCAKTSGECPPSSPRCSPGYTGLRCDSCADGKWGADCSNHCGQCNNGAVCDKTSGECPPSTPRCSPGYMGTRCETGCTGGKWGADCPNDCGQCNDGAVCDKTSGECPPSTPRCSPGYMGTHCDTACTDGKWGADCPNDCGQCYNGAKCDKATGECPPTTPRCSPGYNGTLCKTNCSDGMWGADCRQSCGQCYSDNVCDRTSGACPRLPGTLQCTPGYQPPSCTQVLTNSCLFGPDCLLDCNCDPSVTCDPQTGCPGSCTRGWDGPICQRQNVALGRPTTQSSTHIHHEVPLGSGFAVDGNSGDCTIIGITHTGISGDPAPFWEVTLDNAYSINSFQIYNRAGKPVGSRLAGFTLSVGNSSGNYRVCYRAPAGQDPGEVVTGNCTTGGPVSGNTVRIQVPGTILSLCEVLIYVCSPGTYGPACGQNCGFCTEGRTVCDATSGDCPELSGLPRCIPGYTGDKCQTVCTSGKWGADCPNDCGQCNNGAVCDKTSGECPLSTPHCSPGYMGTRCDTVCADGKWEADCPNDCGQCNNGAVCDKSSGECPLSTQRCSPGYMGTRCDTESPSPVGQILGAVVGAIVLAVVVVVLVMIYRRRRHQTSKATDQGPPAIILNMDDRQPQHNEGYAEGNGDGEMNPQPDGEQGEGVDDGPTLVPIDSLLEYVRRKTASDGFKDEYEKLPVGLHAEYHVADQAVNKAKSRYRNLVAYDHSRVILKREEADNQSDYINACYINGYNGPMKFIASQGPNHVIINDFLRMIWEQNVGKLVMVTNLVEVTKVKCDQYWPNEGSKQFGVIGVTLMDEDIYANYIIRTLQLSHAKVKNKTHDVKQFHFTTWPDHGAPSNATGLLDFRHQVSRYQSHLDGPIVVHCSAGIGRTGTYIALDYLIEQAEEERVVDVLACVRLLREQRVNMVQTQGQYEFLHEALVEAVYLVDTFVPSVDFAALCAALSVVDQDTGQPKMAEQFKVLATLTPAVKKSSVKSARHADNISKNRTPRILAADSCRPFLSTNVSGCNDYINAVFLPSFKLGRGFLITQTPLPNTITDFWRLVYEQDVSVIVMLDQADTRDKDVGIYWPNTRARVEFEPFAVEVTDMDKNEAFSVWTYQLRYQDKSTTYPIKHFRCNFWSGPPSAESASALLAVMNEAVIYQQQTGNGPILVHCRDGVTKSGLFCSVSSVIERLKVDQEVNILQTVKQMRANRPQIITDLNQLDTLYQIVLQYLENFQTYANFS